jgi:type I restriction enzyme S subunit
VAAGRAVAMNQKPSARRERPAPGEGEAGALDAGEALKSELEAPLRRFVPYSEYKDSGVEWLGKIPVQWETRRWRYCCRIKEGLVDPRDELLSERVLIAPNHIETGTGRVLFTETSREQGAISGKYAVCTGDLIYSKIRPALNKVCIAAGEWLCSADMYPVRIIAHDLAPKLLLYFMLSGPFVRLMVDESMRVAMPKINRNTLSACPIAVPPVSDQLDIVAFLDRETAKIDALVAKKRRLVELLNEKRSALINKGATRGFGASAAMKDTSLEWLGNIPVGWNVQRLKTTATINDEALPDDTDPRREILYVDISNVDSVKGILYKEQLTFEKAPSRARRIVRTGDVIVSTVRTYLRAIAEIREPEENLIVSTGFAVIRPRKQFFGSFGAYALRAPYFIDRVVAESVGVSFPAINASEIGCLPILLPPEEEQRVIARYLESETGKIDLLVAKEERLVEMLQDFRTALISAAVTGKIDVRGEVA